MSLHIFIGTVP